MPVWRDFCRLCFFCYQSLRIFQGVVPAWLGVLEICGYFSKAAMHTDNAAKNSEASGEDIEQMSSTATTEIELDNAHLAVPVYENAVQVEDAVQVDDVVQVKKIGDDLKQLGGNSVNMRLSAGGVEFAMDTRIDTRADLVEANAKLELALNMLSVSQSRLEAAFIRIGQLETQAEQKAEIIKSLQEKISLQE